MQIWRTLQYFTCVEKCDSKTEFVQAVGRCKLQLFTQKQKKGRLVDVTSQNTYYLHNMVLLLIRVRSTEA
jgi:hypothetical protein